jgi:UDP-glucose 4-epimerase
VRDCLDAMLIVAARHGDEPGAHIYNLGTDETSTVKESVRAVSEHFGLSPELHYTGGRSGWVGDSPLIRLDTTRIRGLGWRPKLTIREGVERTLLWLDANEGAWREQGVQSAVGGGLT